MTFEEKLNHIEEISKKLQSPDTQLEEAVSLYEEGVKTANEIDAELRKYERRIEIVTTPAEDLENGIVTDQYTK